MKNLYAIALSGGIDSLVAAHRLKAKGYDLFGVHFFHGYESGPPKTSFDKERILRQLQPLQQQLDIPIEIVDLSEAFQEEVVSYFCHAYFAGQTPNPCLRCNPIIKFGRLFETVQRMGATHLATGHYARKVQTGGRQDGLYRGLDPIKDQSYFLAFLTRAQLSIAEFPLGGMLKSETRQLASANNLKPITRAESQDICFVKAQRYSDFLDEHSRFQPQPGPIRDMAGKRIGKHQGLHLFTIGQRRGINCPAAHPYYVVDMDPGTNTLIVGEQDALLTEEAMVSNTNWLVATPSRTIDAQVQIRYRHRPQAAQIIPENNHRALIRFVKPLRAITPGQGAVFYDGDRVLGGGWIVRS